MIEIRIHGRGGQGAVTTGQILAIAAFYDGKESQTFPMFGVERTGAPVQAFARISDEHINLRSQIYNPDVVLVLDASLVECVNVTDGLKRDGILIVNSNRSPKELKIKGEFEVHAVDATSCAMEIFKKPIVNTAMLGAFAAITKAVSLGSLEKAIDETILRKKGAELAELNKKAIRAVCNRSK
ncbi:MAG: pyruvate ferredoxin oxidoreductase subunit gamma [Candidatus Woesearchaeota archaeon]